MASLKKRLKNIEKTLARFAAGEKRIIDLIVSLVTEHVERRVAERIEARLAEVKGEIVEDIGRRLPKHEDLERLVEESVRRALEKHDADRRGDEDRFAEAVARVVEAVRPRE